MSKTSPAQRYIRKHIGWFKEICERQHTMLILFKENDYEPMGKKEICNKLKEKWISYELSKAEAESERRTLYLPRTFAIRINDLVDRGFVQRASNNGYKGVKENIEKYLIFSEHHRHLISQKKFKESLDISKSMSEGIKNEKEKII